MAVAAVSRDTVRSSSRPAATFLVVSRRKAIAGGLRLSRTGQIEMVGQDLAPRKM